LATERIKAFIQKYRTDGYSNASQGRTSVFYEKVSDEHTAENNDRSALKKTVRKGGVMHIAMHNEKSDICASKNRYSTQQNKKNIVKTIRACSANVGVKDVWGYTPLHHAVEHGDRAAIVFYLFNGADVNAQDLNGRTPLHVACYATEDRHNMINTLVAHGARVNTRDYRGITPLHIAAYNTKHVRASLHINACPNMHMLLALGANPNMQDATGDTPLHMTARCGAQNIFCVIRLLISYGADFRKMNFSENAPFHVAVEYGNDHAVRAFLAYCAERRPNGNGRTPFHTAIEKNAMKIAAMIAPYYDLNLPDCVGKTPLHLAAQNGSQEAMAFLMQRGATSCVHDHDGLTPYDMMKQNNGKKSAEDMIAYLFAHQ
jgi:ankyrin repeat protein